MPKWLRSLLDSIGIVQLLQTEFVRTLIWPTLYAVLTGTAGIIGGIPLMWVLLAVAVTFAATTQGVLRADEFRERNRVKDRLYFSTAWFGRDFEVREDKTVLTNIQFGFYMENAAPYPMYFKVLEIRSSFAGRIKENPKYETITGTAIKDRSSLYRDAPIPLPGGLPVAPDERLTGTLHFKVAYGRSESYGHIFEHDLKINVIADKRRPGEFSWNWAYAGQKGGTED